MNPILQIQRYNAGREPERLRMKYERMRAGPSAFLRGTAHLFHERLGATGVLRSAPPAWCCGDLHLGNFGSYKGDNRLVYFDINDFDEAALAPASWDVLRMLTSVIVAGEELGLKGKALRELARHALDAYADTLAGGKAYWLERQTATGPIRALLEQLALRERGAFLDKRCTGSRRARQLDVSGRHALPADGAEQHAVRVLMREVAAQHPDPEFFDVLDVARRVAGIGSLGVERYVILVRGKGGAKGNYLFDLKQVLPSTLAPAAGLVQPHWPSEAHRVCELQRRLQAVSVAHLQPLRLGDQNFVLRELQPSEDRLDLVALHQAGDALRQALVDLARLLAWGQLRSAGRQGSAIADELVDFGRRGVGKGKWRDRLMDLALDAARHVHEDAAVFNEAVAEGAFAV